MQRGSIRKRHGSWKLRLWVDDPQTGERRRIERGGFATKAEAATALDTLLRRDRLGLLVHEVYPERLTLRALVDEYLAQHQASETTLWTLRARLRYATAAFGDLEIRRLTARELRGWRAQLKPGSARGVHQALRQVLQYAVDVKLLDENPAAQIPNPAARRDEITPFSSWDELELLADEIDPRYAALPVFAAGTGLRPEEWIALERGDVDRQAKVVHVRRTFAYGSLKDCGKTDRSRRRVPLRARVIDALDRQPVRLDTPLLFPAPQGGHLDLNRFRARVWKPAILAAGLPSRRIYDCRHTYATFSIAAGVSLFYLARFMGTSVEMIDRTYGHLYADAEDTVRGLLDAWDAREDAVVREADR